MHIYRRIIPRLDIKGPNLVKGIHLEGLRVLGKPEDFAEYYYKNGADELIYIDVVASLYNRNSLHDIISRTAKKIFIPLTIGGGIRTIDDIKSVLRAGADKVSINTAAIKDPSIIRKASSIFGSSTITISIEAIQQQNGDYLAYIDNGREYTGVEVISWAKMVEELGAGEILLTSIDNDGTGRGFDITLTEKVASSVSIPVIASGGVGKTEHVQKVLEKTEASAVALASILHYGILSNNVNKKDYHDEGNTEFISKGQLSKKIYPSSIADIKKTLLLSCIPVRK